jgi:hypothetical protein
VSQPFDTSPRPCACGCGVSFRPTKRHQIYATEKCRKSAYWQKHETIGPEYAEALDWALAKLAKQRDNLFYVQLQTLRERIKTSRDKA